MRPRAQTLGFFIQYNREMKYLFHGDDGLSLQAEKKLILQTFRQKHPDGQIHRFDFSEMKSYEAAEEELSPSLFSAPKFFLFENTNDFFEEALERAEMFLEKTKEQDCLFLESQKLPQKNSFLKLAQKHFDEVRLFEKKKRNFQSLVKHLESELQIGSLDKGIQECIRERSLGNDEQALQDIQKVLTFASNKKVSKEDLDALVPHALEVKIFDALDALVSGQKERALVLFQAVLLEEDVFRILSLCVWQVRQMLLVQEAEAKHGASREVIGKETNIHPFVVQKILRSLPNFSQARLTKGLRLLSRIDADLKESKRTKEGAIQHFIFSW